MSKILSVSIAAYNVERFLAEVLDCFLNDNILKKCEVIIVNDGSTDTTCEIARKYIEKYPDTFILVDKENGGWGSTLNAAIQIATGKYFKQLDGDDLYDTENLSNYLDELVNVDTDVVVTPYLTFEDGTGKILDTFIENQHLQRNKVYAISEIAEDMAVAMHSCTFKTEMLQREKISLLEHCFYTDVEFVLKSLNVANTVTFIDLLIYKYRLARSGQSVSTEGLKKHYLEHCKVVMELLNYEKEKVSDDYVPFFEKRMQAMVKDQYWIFMMLDPSKTHQEEFRRFDECIRKKYRKYYKVKGKKIMLLRLSRFKLYKLLVG